jgi:hypothetical protein
MNNKINVTFTQAQWEEVFYAIMVAETSAQEKKQNKLYGILLRAEEAMKIGKDKKEEKTED